MIKKTTKRLLERIFPNLLKRIRLKRVSKALYANPQKFRDGILFNGLQDIGSFELGLFKFINGLNQHTSFINIGANAGVNVVRLFNRFEKILAIEASNENLKLLYHNIVQNNIKNTIVLPIAAYSCECILNIYGASTGSSILRGWNNQTDEGVLTQALSLDYVFQNNDLFNDSLVLIDVEGAEFDVVLGASNFIRKARSSFIIEVTCREMRPNEEFNPNFMKIFEIFWENGYKSYEVLENGKCIQLNLKAVQQIIHTKRMGGLMVYFSRVDLQLI